MRTVAVISALVSAALAAVAATSEAATATATATLTLNNLNKFPPIKFPPHHQPKFPECTPPAYICKPDHSGWLVCNVDGKFLDGGSCGPFETCKTIDNLPFCV